MAKEILIAVSDKADQEEFQRIFETTDYHLVFSESGGDVLLRMKLFKPDLIVAGTALTEKNGFELCGTIKSDPEFRLIPFILLLNVLEEFPEKEKKRLKPDGVLSKPLREREVLNIVDRLLETKGAQRGGVSGKEMEQKLSSDVKKGDFKLDKSAEQGREEIIDLLDVVEEPESKMSIDDFALGGKEEPLGEIPSLESWEKMAGEEKLAAEEGMILSVKEQAEKEEIPVRSRREEPLKKAPREEEIFEKIELEDILEKVGREEPPPVLGRPLAKQVRGLEEKPSATEEPEDKSLGLEEFETLLKKGVEIEAGKEEPLEEALQPLSIEEEKAYVSDEMTAIEIPEKELKELEELAEKEFPKSLLEEALEEAKTGAVESLEEEKIEELREEGFGELKEEKIGGLKEELEGLEVEELKGLEAEELKGLEEEELKGFEEEELGGLEVEELKGLEAEELKGLEEEELKGFEAEELKGLEVEELQVVKEREEAEELAPIEELEEMEVPKEEEAKFLKDWEAFRAQEKVRTGVEEVKPVGIARPTEADAEKFFAEAGFPSRKIEQQMGEILSEKVRGMMEEFITKHVPEMTKDLVGLTLERIEKMVREIIPDLAEKMIEEEIRRLEKGEKD